MCIQYSLWHLVRDVSRTLNIGQKICFAILSQAMALSFLRLSSSLRCSAHHQPWFTSCRRGLSMVKSSTDTHRKSLMPFSAIPGPNGSLSNMFDYARRGGVPNIVEILKERFEKFGPIYRETMFGGRRLVNISDADETEKILRIDSFPMRPGFEVIHKIHETRGYCSGLTSNEHEKWTLERTLLATKMLRPKGISELLPGFSEVARDFVKSVSHRQEADKTVLDLERNLFYWIMESTCTFLFDRRLGLYSNRPNPEAIAFVNSAHDVTHNMGKFLFRWLPLYKYFRTPAYNRLEEAVDDLYTIGQNIINATLAKKRRAGLDKSDGEEQTLFDHISASNELTPQMVVNILIGLMAAAIETTSTSVLWLVYMLSRNPEAQEKLYQELKSVLGTGGEISKKTIGSLPYLKACFKESSRLRHLAIIIPRRYDQDVEALGYNIPAGVDIMLFTHVTSSAYSYYGENAKEFVPEQWLRDEAGKKGALHPFASIPFGYGVRMCLGRRVAEAQVYAFFSQLLLSYRLEYAGRTELKQRLSGLVIKPDKPVIVKFISR